jgi:transcriptional regulator with XRE-family HTH domain
VARGGKDPLQISFGLAVRRLRRERKISQEKLSQLAGINRTYMGDVERGERNLSLQNMVKIAAALGVEPSKLLTTMEEEFAILKPKS